MSHTEEKQLVTTSSCLQWLYEKYSASLLGYISGVIPNQEEGEGYLVTILSRFVNYYPDHVKAGDVSWLKLLQFSRGLLPQLQTQATAVIGIATQNRSLASLSNLQKEIFCAVYYHGTSITDLAKRMGENETVIRSEFKIAFDKVRRAG
ncbi:MAG: hypothetical protein EOP48_19980, partial [Sphingobacteriales bacterium]